MKTRLVASVALAAALLLGSAGCTLMSVNGTLVPYQPSDGVAANVGDVKVRNIIGLSDNGDDISLLMTIINTSDSEVDVDFQYEDASGAKTTITLTVEANSSLAVGNGGEEAILREAGAMVGGLIPVYVQYGSNQGVQVQVPVLDGSTAAYADLLPEPLPTFTPTPTATPSESATPAP